MGQKIVYLIRNGQYDRDNVDPIDETSAPLTKTGREQAALTAQAIQDLPIESFVHSPYQQMIETVDILARPFGEIERDESRLLRQYDSLTQMPDSTLHPDVVRLMAESQKKQLDQAFATFFSPAEDGDEQIILVCHGNIIRDLVCRAIGVNPESWAHMMIHNCGISSVVVSPNQQMELVGFNDTTHLPDALKTEQ